MPAPSTCADLLELVRKSGVADAQQVHNHVEQWRIAGQMPTRVRELADLLVRDGLLTVFQAKELLRGKWRGFTFGNYKVLERLSVSDTSRIYLCEHLPDHRYVVAKTCLVAKLKHPNLVQARGIRQGNGCQFLIMEYVDGLSLQAAVEEHGPLDVIHAADYVRQAAEALAHVHQSGWFHGDIHPGNLLLDRKGTVKVLHVGLAHLFHGYGKASSPAHDDRAAAAVAGYHAPERVIRHHPADARADIYSLGATLYFLLTGHPPPVGEWSPSPGTAGQSDVEDGATFSYRIRAPTSVRTLRPEIPEALAVIVEKAMALDPERRYPTAADLAQTLSHWTQGAHALPSPEQIQQPSSAAREDRRPPRAESNDVVGARQSDYPGGQSSGQEVCPTNRKQGVNPGTKVFLPDRLTPAQAPLTASKCEDEPSPASPCPDSPPQTGPKVLALSGPRAHKPMTKPQSERPLAGRSPVISKSASKEGESNCFPSRHDPPRRADGSSGATAASAESFSPSSPARKPRSAHSEPKSRSISWLWHVAAGVVLILVGVYFAGLVLRASGKGRAADHSVANLLEKLNDEDPSIRYWAARSLGSFGPKARDAVPALIQALRDPDDNVRLGAAYALADIGPDAADAISALTEAAKDRSKEVRTAAVYALKRVQVGSPQ